MTPIATPAGFPKGERTGITVWPRNGAKLTWNEFQTFATEQISLEPFHGTVCVELSLFDFKEYMDGDYGSEVFSSLSVAVNGELQTGTGGVEVEVLRLIRDEDGNEIASFSGPLYSCFTPEISPGIQVAQVTYEFPGAPAVDYEWYFIVTE